jgi:hypothetical protein
MRLQPPPPPPLALACARQVQVENEAYLAAHPELPALVRRFLAAVLERKPSDVTAFAVHFFAGGEGEGEGEERGGGDSSAAAP